MSQVEEIKDKIDIVDFINSRVPLKKAGRNYKANCPFHQEKTPSFFVNPQRQIWRCFGACDEGGDVISFLQKYDNLEFAEALRELAEEAGVKLQTGRFETQKSRLRDKLYEVNNLAAEYYHYLLTKHDAGAKAREYLARRKIKKDTVVTFKLGYAPNLWDGLLNFLTKKGYNPSLLQQAGLVLSSRKKEGYYDRFRARIIFPIYDHRKKLIGFSGRTLIGEKGAKYINTPETEIYHKRKTFYGLAQTGKAIAREDSAIIVEGEFDVISSFQLGISNIVAVKGSGLSNDQIRLLKRYTNKIIFALDADQAGQEAVKRGVLLADDSGMDVYVAPVAEGKDPDELIRKSPNKWRAIVKKPVSYFDYLINSTVRRYGTKTAQSKHRIVEELAIFFSRSQNPIIKDHYSKLLAEKLQLSESTVAQAIDNAERKQTGSYRRITQKGKKANKKRVQNRIWLLEEYLLSLVLQSENPGEMLELLLRTVKPEDMPTCAAQKIFLRLLRKVNGTKKKIDSAKFIEGLEKELVEFADRAFLADLGGVFKDKKSCKRELIKAAKELKVLILKDKLKKASEKVKILEKEKGKERKLKKLNIQIDRITKEIKSLV